MGIQNLHSCPASWSCGGGRGFVRAGVDGAGVYRVSLCWVTDQTLSVLLPGGDSSQSHLQGIGRQPRK